MPRGQVDIVAGGGGGGGGGVLEQGGKKPRVRRQPVTPGWVAVGWGGVGVGGDATFEHIHSHTYY